MSRLDALRAEYYRSIADGLTADGVLLDNEKNRDAREMMDEAARCLREAADVISSPKK